jgi:tRNA(fMet)-specific endonuclease VapC
MLKFMLDTNAASRFIRGQSVALNKKIIQIPTTHVCISALSEAELRFGLAKRPEATQLELLVKTFLKEIMVLNWTSKEAYTYGILRAELERSGTPLSAVDTLIAAHALSANCTLVTADTAFSMVPDLKIENWEV